MRADITQREIDVWRRVALGQMSKTIAYELVVTEATVKTHVGRLAQKLGLLQANRVTLAMLYLDAYPEDRENILQAARAARRNFSKPRAPSAATPLSQLLI